MKTDWIDEAFMGPAWHGPSLVQTIRGVDDSLAAWTPGPGRHSIREIVVHAAWWKRTVRQRVSGVAVDPFPYRGRNWFDVSAVPPGSAGARTWRDDVRLLKEEHDRLRHVVARLRERDALRRVHAGQTVLFNIRGIGAHDVYHAGQIQLIKALRRRSR